MTQRQRDMNTEEHYEWILQEHGHANLSTQEAVQALKDLVEERDELEYRRRQQEFLSELPDEGEICTILSVPHDYIPDGASYTPETAIKNKYRREGAMWFNALVRGRDLDAEELLDDMKYNHPSEKEELK